MPVTIRKNSVSFTDTVSIIETNGQVKNGCEKLNGDYKSINGKTMSTKAVGRTTKLEFGGIIGAHLMVLGLPLTVLIITLICNKDSCDLRIPDMPNISIDITSVLLLLGWLLLHAVLAVIPMGTLCEGQPLRDSSRLKYRCNAFIALELSLLLIMWLLIFGAPVNIIYQKFLSLAIVAILFSYALATFLYIKSLFVPNHALAEGGNSGNVVYDYFIGHELNPRLGPLDLKFFFELRPGLIGWVMLDISFIAEAYVNHGGPSPALILITIFHFWYVADALWFEEAVLTTMDIVHDGFGLMLAFGDIVWVPFLYSLQARYALEHPTEWCSGTLVLFALLHVVGYVIFRGANSQKNEFRKNPDAAHLAYLETLPTSTGKRLLVSGWWGMCRHPNYFGDLIMALAWSLPCGFNNIMPFFYPIYFLCLLIHRNMRDEVACRKKYAADWDKYCARVKYRIFPYIF